MKYRSNQRCAPSIVFPTTSTNTSKTKLIKYKLYACFFQNFVLVFDAITNTINPRHNLSNCLIANELFVEYKVNIDINDKQNIIIIGINNMLLNILLITILLNKSY